MDVTPALIGGKRRTAISGQTIDAVNPATGALIGRFPRCDAEDVAVTVESAARAAREWRRTTMQERAEFLHQLAEAVDSARTHLLDLDVADNGSPRHEMAADVDYGIWHLRYFAGLGHELRGTTVPTGHDRLNYTVREPYGVVARIVPFNHPLMFALARIAAPLMAGNAVIVKPSEMTSLSTLALADLLETIFPPGLVSVVTGYGNEAGDALVTHPGIPRIAFIGSAQTGRLIQARAASVAVKHVTLELGGKNPIVVWPDADLDAAMEGVISGMRFNFQGQACGSTSRLLVHRDIYGDFIERLGERLAALHVGDPLDPTTEVGALVSETQLEKVLSHIDRGLNDGARLVAGGARLVDGDLGRGFFVPPTLFADVSPTSRLAQEEIFGPVLAAMPVDGFDHAVEVANGVEYGLTASIYTSDLTTAHAFARDVEAGYVWVNENQRHFPGTPYGGVKNSGVGREENFEELESYTQVKNVHLRFGHVRS